MAEKLTPKKPDKDAPKVAEPRHGLRKIKSFVDTSPLLYPIKEAVDERLDQLIRFGLGDPSKIAFYRQALSDPKSAVNSATYRQYVGEALSKLLTVILSDPTLYLRVRTLLQTRGRGPMTLEDVALAAMNLTMESRPVPVQDADEPVRKKTVHKKHPRQPKGEE